MPIRLYNTLTKSKDVFVPLDAKNVRMYVCGPTVYDFAHIGNARPAIVFDVLFRLLRHEYGDTHVAYARNVTDVDDKINARAAEIAAAKNISVETARAELTAGTERQYVEDVTALGCLPPTVTPRATEHISGDDRPDRKAAGRAASPMRPMVMCCSTFRRRKAITASSPTAR